jgi:hypothetical protein
MSYTLMLVRASPGTSDEEVEKIALAASEAERVRRPAPPDAETERQKRVLVEALIEECPELEGGEIDYAALARDSNVSEEEARQRYHWWRVTGPEEGAAIEITLYDSYIDIDASRVETEVDWEDLWRYLEILVREGGFVVWDGQGPNVVDLAAGPLGDGTRKKRPKPAKRRRSRDEPDEGNDAVESEDVRRGGEIAKLINRIIDEAIAAPLALAGFQRSGRTWRRQVDDGVIQVVNMGWSSRDRGVEGWFGLNAGVYFRALAESIALFPLTNSPKEHDCHLRRRHGPPGGNGWTVRVPGVAKPDSDAGRLLGGVFSWLDRRADSKAAKQHVRATRELHETLERHAFPWLERVSTLRAARDVWAKGPDMFWGAHASLLLGEREEAARILNRVLEGAKGNPEFSEMVRTWGRKQSLIA